MLDLFSCSIIGFVAGIFIFLRGLLLFRQKRLIENVPTSKTRSIAMGLVEISGNVLPAEKKILKSPFSGKECIYYRYKIEELRSTGKNTYWATIRNGEEGVPFFLEDETGAVLVDPSGARVEITNPNLKNRFNSKWGRDPPEQIRKFLASQGLGFESLFGMNKTMRYTEWFLGLADRLYIMGTAKDNPHVEEATAKNSVEDIMVGKGEHEKIFYISDSDEKKILKKMTWMYAGGIFGGALLTVGCLALMLLYLSQL